MYLLQDNPSHADPRITAPTPTPTLRRDAGVAGSSRRGNAAHAVRGQRALTLQERQLVLRRSVHLNEPDRVLIKQLLADGRTYRDLAAIIPAGLKMNTDPLRIHTMSGLRLNNTMRLLRSAQRLRRRFARLAKRLLSVECTYLLAHDVHMCPTRHRVCCLRFILGHTLRQIGSLLALPLHIVRRICDNASALAAVYAMQQPTRSQLN